MQQPHRGEKRRDRSGERDRRGGVQVLSRAAAILRLLAADSSGGLTFTVAVSDLDKSSAAISVPMPAARFHADGEHVSSALLRLRSEVQVALQSSAAAGASPVPQG